MSDFKNNPVRCEACGGRYLEQTGKGRHLRTLKHIKATKKDEEVKLVDKMQEVKAASVLLEVKEFIDKKIKEVLNIKASS